MKTKHAVLIGCGALLIILVLAFILGFFIGFKPQGSKKLSPDSWLVLDPSGNVADYNELSSSRLWGSPRPSTEDICRKIRFAASDKRIKGILIKPSFAQISFANLGEIGLAMEDFKAAGKPVYSHFSMQDQKGYLLCAMADSVYMEPSASAGLILEGVEANLLFYKDLLSKLGIRMHVVQVGEFKGYDELYTKSALSPGTEQNLRQALKGRYDLLVGDLAKHRKLDPAQALQIYEERPEVILLPAEAKKYGLVDELASYDALLDKLQITKDNRVSLKDYQDTAASTHKNKIAILNLSGVITPSISGFSSEATINAEKVDRAIRSIKKDKNIKALVVRLNSPGGSALESEIIFQKLDQLELPVVVSMGGIAASGGYYISCAGDYIVADPHTITGSIGVVSTLPEGEELSKKIGLGSQTISYGKFAGSYTFWEKTDPEFLSSFERYSKSVYDEFKLRVSTSRKLNEEEIAAAAEGRVFIAEDARKLKLIDEVGSLQTAVDKAAELAKITDYELTQYPGKISIFEFIKQSGMFEMAVKYIRDKDMSLTERLEEYLKLCFPPQQCLYILPYNLDQ